MGAIGTFFFKFFEMVLFEKNNKEMNKIEKKRE
jgi:hypothetical protein